MEHVTLLYFAVVRERLGLSEERLPWPSPAPASALLERLCSLHPALLALLPHVRVSVNEEFVEHDASIPPGARVALIPPVSGGAGLFKVVDRPLGLTEVIAAVAPMEHGGLVTFTGTVRNQTRGRKVLRLEYEAYAPMAERILAEIGGEVTVKWPGARIAIVHRIGVLAPGEAAVVIATSAPHRGEAFKACEYAIERLKEDVPVWKKEIYEDGGSWVGMGP